MNTWKNMIKKILYAIGMAALAFAWMAMFFAIIQTLLNL
jgi:hypothetical protein